MSTVYNTTHVDTLQRYLLLSCMTQSPRTDARTSPCKNHRWDSEKGQNHP